MQISKTIGFGGGGRNPALKGHIIEETVLDRLEKETHSSHLHTQESLSQSSLGVTMSPVTEEIIMGEPSGDCFFFSP